MLFLVSYLMANKSLCFAEDGAKGLVDGDIMPPPLEKGNDEHENEKRNAIRDRRGLWRTRVLPYVFDGALCKYTYVFLSPWAAFIHWGKDPKSIKIQNSWTVNL